MGGGNRVIAPKPKRRRGLSPRGRGKLTARQRRRAHSGSIPAWAGETNASRALGVVTAVYPRVGGGNNMLQTRCANSTGLSPRGRGKPYLYGGEVVFSRSIPAWAGETRRLQSECDLCSVYPRVGGGNHRLGSASRLQRGLSPRGRGKLVRGWEYGRYRRSIPAWAGETHCLRAPKTSCRVYPRVGGGNKMGGFRADLGAGLSPRGRGKPKGVRRRCAGRRSIPAWAGETPGKWEQLGYGMVYPRVGGGNGIRSLLSLKLMGLSPRGRGKHCPPRLCR